MWSEQPQGKARLSPLVLCVLPLLPLVPSSCSCWSVIQNSWPAHVLRKCHCPCLLPHGIVTVWPLFLSHCPSTYILCFGLARPDLPVHANLRTVLPSYLPTGFFIFFFFACPYTLNGPTPIFFSQAFWGLYVPEIFTLFSDPSLRLFRTYMSFIIFFKKN